MGQFVYSPVNPVRLTHQTAQQAKYNTVPFDRQQAYDCYSQKFQFTDTAIFQFVSDWPVALKLYDKDSKLVATPAPLVTLINNETASWYKFVIDWAVYSEGGYYFTAEYTDDTASQLYQSELIQVKQNWPNTILFEYWNSYNKYSINFKDNTVYQFRVEGVISLFNPEFDDEIYNDQYRNTSLLDSIPFRTFTLDVGGAPLVPEWVIDRTNWIFGCDRVKIDGTFYRNTDGSKWDIERTEPDGTRFINGKLTVIEVNELFLQELTPGETPTGGFKIVSRIVESKNIGGNTVISAQPQFNSASLIKYIAFVNRGAEFTVSAGTSSGAVDLMKPAPIPTGADTVLINQRLSGSSAIYLTIPAGSDMDIVIGYDQFDAELITPGSIITQIKGRPRSISQYHYTTPEQLVLDFDLATGLGIGDFAGTAIMNGNNTTQDWGGKVPMAYKKGMKWSALGIAVANDPEIPLGVDFGEYMHILLAAELPKLKAMIPGATSSNAGNKIPFSGSSPAGQGITPIPVLGGDPTIAGPTGDALLNLPHNNIQPTIYCIYYKELA